MKNSVYDYLSMKLKSIFEKYDNYTSIYEIRIRVGQPLVICTDQGECGLLEDGVTGSIDKAYRVTAKDVKEIMEYVSGYSPYAYEEELKNGYITIPGGNRIGICGKAIIDINGIKTIKNITSINVRMARAVVGCSDRYMSYLYENNRLCHTLIISPPCSGKTTFLRDVIRNLSDGYGGILGKNVAVVDERSEIAGNYLGMRTDVLDGCPKSYGMLMLIRSMAPEVIAVDELGKKEDVEALEYCMNCGTTIIATIHAADLDELKNKNIFRYMLENRLFKRIVVMSGIPKKGTVVDIFNEDGGSLWNGTSF